MKQCKYRNKILTLLIAMIILINAGGALVLHAADINPVTDVTLIQVEQSRIPNDPIKENLVKNAEIIYRVSFYVRATRANGSPVTDMPIDYIRAENGSICGSRFTSIDSTGKGIIELDIRGPMAGEMYCSVDDVRSAPINVLIGRQAIYEKGFYCTGYITALESDYSGNKVQAPGITDATFCEDFLSMVRLNGSGKANSGKYLHYNSSTGNYSYLNPTTATGTTPTAGRTIAVDPYYIPRAKVNSVWKRATVNISGIGNRVAEDGGAAIEGYRIDVYMGEGNAAMIGWANGTKGVSLISID